MLADDHEVVRRGLRALLDESGLEVCAEASNGREAIEQAGALRPDVVVLDATMPELGGVEAARQILKVAPKTEILILTMHESSQMVREALDAGARGYLLKSDAGRDLVAAVRAVCHHKVFFSPRVEKIVQNHSRETRGKVGGCGPLTQREREIVQLLAEGESSKDIAAALGIAIKTVETHRTNIMRKLDVHSIADLVRYAIRNNIAEP